MAEKTVGWKIKAINGKGLGWIPTKCYDLGDVIYIESPLFTLSYPQNRNDLPSIIQSLDTKSQIEYLSLASANRYNNKLLDIYKTNSFPPKNDDGSSASIYLKLSRINHSCSPNAMMFYQENTKMGIICIHKIKKGEEITISYRNKFFDKFDERQKELIQNFGFQCQCKLCARKEEPDIAISELQSILDWLNCLLYDNYNRLKVSLSISEWNTMKKYSDKGLKIINQIFNGDLNMMHIILRYHYVIQLKLYGINERNKRNEVIQRMRKQIMIYKFEIGSKHEEIYKMQKVIKPISMENYDIDLERLCSNCSSIDIKLSICGRCKTVWYCNVKCQRAHWMIHKPKCKSPKIK